jgi:hypothetical protein
MVVRAPSVAPPPRQSVLSKVPKDAWRPEIVVLIPVTLPMIALNAAGTVCIGDTDIELQLAVYGSDWAIIELKPENNFVYTVPIRSPLPMEKAVDPPTEGA